VVFVAVRQDNAVHFVAAISKPREVRQDEIDTVHIGFRKHQPCVDNHYATILFNRHAVATNLAESTEKGDRDLFFRHVRLATE